MSDCDRSVTVTLTIEMPLEVAEWLASNGEQLAQMARVAAVKQHHNSETNKKQREQKREKLKTEFEALGRLGYRLYRRAGGCTDIVKGRALTRILAGQLGLEWNALELAIVRFKRALKSKQRQRRNREFVRLYQAGVSNTAIAARYDMHPLAVSAIIKKFPGNSNTLKEKDKVTFPRNSPVASPIISCNAAKQAGVPS